MTTLGLRIDVDTLRGTRSGIPRLLEILQRHDLLVSFFFSVGPDNMGRHLWRLLRPTFLVKMLRSRAASLYGWDILLCGTFGTGPDIGVRCADQIRQVMHAGHEIGLHAWDHQRWQAKVDKLHADALHCELQLGWERLEWIAQAAPCCTAAPGWRMNTTALELRERFASRYNSDCRGTSIFGPILADGSYGQPQIPTTLPTYDEYVGPGKTAAGYYQLICDSLRPDGLNVLTIHAEVEGNIAATLFDQFLQQLHSQGVKICPLGQLLPALHDIPPGKIDKGHIPGRDGWLAVQREIEENETV